MKLTSFVIIASLWLSGHLAAAANDLPVVAVSSVNLDKYQGLWYEIASIPNTHMKKCVSGVTSEYKILTGGLIQVFNRCVQADGSQMTIEGRAKITDKNSNAKLKVTYVKLLDWAFSMGGEYWIIGLDQNYEWAVVSDPGRQYGRIISRTPYLSKYRIGEIDKNLRAQGFDTCKFITTIQKDGLDEKIEICKIKSFFNRF